MKALFIASISVLLAVSASGELTAVGVYTDDTLATNGAIRDARFFNGTGPGNDPGLVLGVHEFASLAKPSFEKGLGGVVDFESGTIDTPKSFRVRFDDGAKTISFTQSTASAYIIKSYVKDDRTPTSGTNALTKETGSPDFQFRLASFKGRAPQEAIIAFGITVLGRNNSLPQSSWTGRAYLEDRAGDTAIIRSRISDLNTGSGNATDNAFFGFRAPEGWFINKIVINSDSHIFTSVDDLAFVTAIVKSPAESIPAASPIAAAVPVVAAPTAAAPPPVAASPAIVAAPPSRPAPGIPAVITEVKAGTAAFQFEPWIAGALGVIIVLLAVLIWTLTRALPVASALPRRGTVATRPINALDAVDNGQTGITPGQTQAELTEFAKQALVQGLYSQRQALFETQKQAKQQLAELESRISKLQLPSQDRIRAYEERIATLEKELSAKDDSVRELTSATLLLVRQRLEEEKERQRNWFR